MQQAFSLPPLHFTGIKDRTALLSAARAWLEDGRRSLQESFLRSGDSARMLSANAALIDALIASFAAHTLSGKDAPCALVAVGGYGRRELYPYSDIDLMFICNDVKEAGPFTEAALYFLWDLGLKVGQSHYTVEEALAHAKGDVSIRSNMLDARLVAGNKSLFGAFRERFDKELGASSVSEFIDAKLAERDARHKRFGDSRYMLEPNVKEGKGGLRDVHTLWWLARAAYGIDAFSEVLERELLTQQEYDMFDQARQFLCKTRILLHYQAGHAEERLTFDRQHAMAIAMGYAHPSINRAIERFMRRYFVAVRTVGATTRIFCALLEEEKKRKPHKSLAWLWHAPWKLGHFRLDGERLNVRSPQVFAYNPALMLELFRLSQQHGLDIHPRALQLAARHLPLINDEVRHSAYANGVFLDILLSRKDAEVTLRRMSESGVLGKFIPDFGRVVGQTQFNMYHVYTVDEHTLVAIGLLHALEEGQLRDIAPMASDVIHRIKMRRVLYLALFSHDIAKGRGGDHSELGEKLAMRLATRLGFSQAEAETTAWLVRHHLAFSSTAFKRDVNDPKTVQDFVALVKTSERLKLLFVLTVADIRAVSPGVWNAWKASLLRELYIKSEQYIGTGEASLPTVQASELKEKLISLLPGWKKMEVEEYLAQGSPAFLTALDAQRHAAIARMLKQAAHMSMPILLDTQHDYERSSTEITLCTPDQPSLFCRVAGAMALSGANIIGAKIFTLKNGMAVDVFQVQDVAGDVFDRPDRLAKMSVYIEQALSDELDLAREFAGRQPAYGNVSRDALPVPAQVFIENDASNISTVIELTGHDRPGLLYQVTQAMTQLGLSIVTAHISTYGVQVADVFYVKDSFGMKLLHESKIKQVRDALLAAMAS